MTLWTLRKAILDLHETLKVCYQMPIFWVFYFSTFKFVEYNSF